MLLSQDSWYCGKLPPNMADLVVIVFFFCLFVWIEYHLRATAETNPSNWVESQWVAQRFLNIFVFLGEESTYHLIQVLLGGRNCGCKIANMLKRSKKTFIMRPKFAVVYRFLKPYLAANELLKDRCQIISFCLVVWFNYHIC